MKATNKTYSIADLYKWDFPGTSFALLGHPVEHSLSPVMYNAAFNELAKENPTYANWRYFKFDIPSPSLMQALQLCYSKRFLGINLTLPHKVDALKMVNSIDEVAKKMEAINALIFENTGYRGFNTDGSGLEAAIKYELQISIKDKQVILLGAGGAAKAAAVQCLLADCAELWIGNRSVERLEDLLKTLGIMGKGKVHGFKLEKIPQNLPKTGLLINATSLGLHEDDPSPIDLNYFDPSLKIFDMVYKSKNTALISSAQKQGMKACSGLRMLLEQGAHALQIWTNRKTIPKDPMWNALLELNKLIDKPEFG